ncbi:MAG TPA: hypothetical protein HA260_05675 [Thermoplasmata archaeon]|nr:hypothetical protein [Thermoplasmata archaeon]
MVKWRMIAIGCVVIGMLCVIAGAPAETLSEPLGISFSMAPTSFLPCCSRSGFTSFSKRTYNRNGTKRVFFWDA